jgi:hypothetical protein
MLSWVNCAELFMARRTSKRLARPKMEVALYPLARSRDSRRVIFHEQNIAMLLRPGSIEVGLRRSEMTKFTYDAGEMILSRNYREEWVRVGSLHLLILGNSDAALAAVGDGISGALELRATSRLGDDRPRAPVPG